MDNDSGSGLPDNGGLDNQSKVAFVIGWLYCFFMQNGQVIFWMGCRWGINLLITAVLLTLFNMTEELSWFGLASVFLVTGGFAIREYRKLIEWPKGGKHADEA